VVSSLLVELLDAVVSAAFSAVRFSRGASSFWALDRTPQEHRATMSNIARKILLNARPCQTRPASRYTPEGSSCFSGKDFEIGAPGSLALARL
jgi:hypothetical protein